MASITKRPNGRCRVRDRNDTGKEVAWDVRCRNVDAQPWWDEVNALDDYYADYEAQQAIHRERGK